MDAPDRGALMLVRFLAAALIGWSLVELVLYWAVSNHDQAPVQVMPCLVRSLPLLAGLVGFVKARALAEWISNLLDD
jgi:hypothetical protein